MLVFGKDSGSYKMWDAHFDYVWNHFSLVVEDKEDVHRSWLATLENGQLTPDAPLLQ